MEETSGGNHTKFLTEMNKKSYAFFYMLLKNLPGYEKEAAVYDYTDGRTTHLSDLTDAEYKGLCKHLEGIVHLDADRRKAGSRVLTLLTEMGFKTTDKKAWTEIDGFLSDKRIAGKRYRELSAQEHENLIPKLHSLKDKGYNRTNHEM
ncbi:hypothetical protein EZS27_005349 [termite gut metagenome]|uniref:Uncharacterized protein n=1 Tax=termite gut metagenome TaxID=433724 RepID=A0A5J4SPJ4_9ZZZZ